MVPLTELDAALAGALLPLLAGVLDEAAVVLDEDEEHAARDRAVATTATPAAATCCLRRNGISGTPYGF
jgi:hypothetical protein